MLKLSLEAFCGHLVHYPKFTHGWPYSVEQYICFSQSPETLSDGRDWQWGKLGLALVGKAENFYSQELPDIRAGFRKGRGTRDQIANICWTIEKAKEFKKNIYFCSLPMLKSLTVWITTNCGEFFKSWEYKTTLLASEKPVCRSRSIS